MAIKPIHSRLNQGGFDLQRWAVSRKTIMQGRVKQATLVDDQYYWRQYLICQLLNQIEKYKTAPIILALVFGERGAIDSASYDKLKRTGTAHLMAISGMHVGLVAWFAMLLGRGVQLLLPAYLIRPQLPMLFSWLLAIGYVWLSGMAPPALRAGVAITFWFYCRYRGFNINAGQMMVIIVAVLLLIDPLMILSDSFWLSCYAVTVLIFCFKWIFVHNKYKRWYLFISTQLALLLLLTPLQLSLFQGVSLSAFLANIIAVPVISFVILPLVLTATLIQSDFLFYIADKILILLFDLLAKLSSYWLEVSSDVVIFSLLPWIIIIVWRCGFYIQHYLSCMVVIILICLPDWFSNHYLWRVDFIDVGHGLAVVISKNGRAILYDTGSSWDESSMAAIEIIPFLNWQGLTLEGIIISHQDNDHVGGLPLLQQTYPDSWLRSPSHTLKGLPCQQGESWYWQELKFEVLWPEKLVSWAKNGDSCVIKLSDGHYSLLLTGDLEAKQEAILLTPPYDNRKLKADILQVPHHGSVSSSSVAMIRSVEPELAISSNSRFNPWRLPAKRIIERYNQHNIAWLSTADEGQISIHFYTDKWKVFSFRKQLKPRWYHNVIGVKIVGLYSTGIYSLYSLIRLIYMQNDKDLSTWQTFRRLWPMIQPFKLGLIVSAIALIANAATDTFMLSLLKPLLDKGFGDSDSSMLRLLAVIIFGLIIIRGISSFISTYCLAWVSGRVVMNMRRRLFSHMMQMPVSFFDQQSTGTLISRITYDSEQVANSSSDALITVVREGAYIIGLFCMMFYYSWQLSIILVILAPIVSLVIRVVSKRFRNISKNMQTTMGQVTSSAEQMLKGHKEVLIFGGQQLEKQQFDKVSNRMRQQGMKMIAASATADPIIQLIASTALVSVLFIASFPSIKDTLTAGTITVVFSAMIALMKPLKSLSNVNAQFQRGMAACQTLFAILDTDGEKDKGTLIADDVKGDLEFKQVTFTYPGKDVPILRDVSFKVPEGKTVALVGRSGSGKSTIASLVPRFYDVQQGGVLVDGVDVKQYTLASLRDQIGLVSQNVHLFNDTIANNIAYARVEKYSRDDIIRVAKMANAMSFIEKMEQGLDTVIGENGVLLSGGQRQRIAIARALLRDNPILILDEATSALDTESERAIQAALEELQKNRTSLVIAHRLSTIEKADEILVVEDGCIIERGTHDSLLALKGVYAQLHKMQFGV